MVRPAIPNCRLRKGTRTPVNRPGIPACGHKGGVDSCGNKVDTSVCRRQRAGVGRSRGRPARIRAGRVNNFVRFSYLTDMIRPATVYDVPRIQAIINSHAEFGKMLFKSLAELFEHLRDFAVAEEDGQIVGCVALTIIWADLAEIRSLAVDATHHGRGLGRQLVQWCLDEARRLHIRKLMALTYEQRFFERFAFVVVDKDTLPLKVWSDCVRCPKRDGCDEIAMVRIMEDVPVVEIPSAPPTPRGVHIPVLEQVEED